MAKTYREVLSRASSFLESAGVEGYAIQYLFLRRKQWQQLDWLLHMDTPIVPADEAQIDADVAQLLNHQPPQYLLGYETFYDHQFKVTADTLIPRPETEELVAQCLADCPEKPMRVVDIGTGTGAIAISLKLARPQWQVAAVDISEAALAVAQWNANDLAAAIAFYQGDTLLPVIEQQWDLIVSNPPYISHDEWDLMDISVRENEPKLALFAEDNGLAMYKKIAQQAKSCLASSGQIAVEIGFQQGKAVQAIFAEAFPQKEVTIKQDMAGQDRMVLVRHPQFVDK
ncbi:protein-(glutamine-N5) methyltransferase, release factor-specific [Enterococcus sp. 8G7_MSG3316]|uniref:Release factor glutamine methyltransferase n=1 Tax=Candidatus Enterococcus testudinis TaxID=1834191 RepID=A0A242A9R7_9ENTE|nr:peptide chain release factor N(5)-glutamine methyltransferase [Enterococcus sp. 8G7_MSG3316]OTN77692.1 protein-(glutamine-N5) methyltransferase, release factor-specific [Enterococcus sp. 8G7_MSG3316]